MTFDEVISSLETENIIFIGEGHEKEEDHLVQFAVIRHLQESGRRVAVALEMFPAQMQPMLNRWVQGALPESRFKEIYYQAWNEPYRYYSKIFNFARENLIPIVAINAETKLIEDVGRNGPQKLPAEYRRAVSLTSCAGVPEYAGVIRLFEAKIGHAARLPFFCDAQLLRDTLMAYNIAAIFERGNFTVVVLVGSAHALKVAVPRILLQYHGMRSVVLMSEGFARLISQYPGVEKANYLWH